MKPTKAGLAVRPKVPHSNAFRGTFFLEFAIALVTLITLTVGAIDLANILRAYSALDTGVRTALRCSYTTDGDCAIAPRNPDQGKSEALYNYELTKVEEGYNVPTVNYGLQETFLRVPRYQINNVILRQVTKAVLKATKYNFAVQKLYYPLKGIYTNQLEYSDVPIAKGDFFNPAFTLCDSNGNCSQDGQDHPKEKDRKPLIHKLVFGKDEKDEEDEKDEKTCKDFLGFEDDNRCPVKVSLKDNPSKDNPNISLYRPVAYFYAEREKSPYEQCAKASPYGYKYNDKQKYAYSDVECNESWNKRGRLVIKIRGEAQTDVNDKKKAGCGLVQIKLAQYIAGKPGSFKHHAHLGAVGFKGSTDGGKVEADFGVRGLTIRPKDSEDDNSNDSEDEDRGDDSDDDKQDDKNQDNWQYEFPKEWRDAATRNPYYTKHHFEKPHPLKMNYDLTRSGLPEEAYRYVVLARVIRTEGEPECEFKCRNKKTCSERDGNGKCTRHAMACKKFKPNRGYLAGGDFNRDDCEPGYIEPNNCLFGTDGVKNGSDKPQSCTNLTDAQWAKVKEEFGTCSSKCDKTSCGGEKLDLAWWPTAVRVFTQDRTEGNSDDYCVSDSGNAYFPRSTAMENIKNGSCSWIAPRGNLSQVFKTPDIPIQTGDVAQLSYLKEPLKWSHTEDSDDSDARKDFDSFLSKVGVTKPADWGSTKIKNEENKDVDYTKKAIELDSGVPQECTPTAVNIRSSEEDKNGRKRYFVTTSDSNDILFKKCKFALSSGDLAQGATYNHDADFSKVKWYEEEREVAFTGKENPTYWEKIPDEKTCKPYPTIDELEQLSYEGFPIGKNKLKYPNSMESLFKNPTKINERVARGDSRFVLGYDSQFDPVRRSQSLNESCGGGFDYGQRFHSGEGTMLPYLDDSHPAECSWKDKVFNEAVKDASGKYRRLRLQNRGKLMLSPTRERSGENQFVKKAPQYSCKEEDDFRVDTDYKKSEESEILPGDYRGSDPLPAECSEPDTTCRAIFKGFKTDVHQGEGGVDESKAVAAGIEAIKASVPWIKEKDLCVDKGDGKGIPGGCLSITLKSNDPSQDDGNGFRDSSDDAQMVTFSGKIEVPMILTKVFGKSSVPISITRSERAEANFATAE